MTHTTIINDLRQSIIAIHAARQSVAQEKEILDKKELLYCAMLGLLSGIISAFFIHPFFIIYSIGYTGLFFGLFLGYEHIVKRPEKINKKLALKYHEPSLTNSLVKIITNTDNQKEVILYLYSLNTEQSQQVSINLQRFLMKNNYNSAAQILINSFMSVTEQNIDDNMLFEFQKKIGIDKHIQHSQLNTNNDLNHFDKEHYKEKNYK